MTTDTQCDLRFRLVPGEVRGEFVREGGTISYAVGGAPVKRSRGVVVLVHGVASNGSRWEEFAEKSALRCDWTLVRFDLRGHGASECKKRAVLETHADDILEILDRLGARKAVLLGHSLGAQAAMRFAAIYHERTRALVLLDPLIDEALTPKALKLRARLPILHFVERCARFWNELGIRRRLPAYSLRAHDEKARRMLAKGGDELKAFVKEYSSPFADLKHIHTADYARDLIEVGRPTPDLTELGIPVFVIASSQGTYTDAARLSAWARKLPGSRVETVACFHWPLTECPEDVDRRITSWLNGPLSQQGKAE